MTVEFTDQVVMALKDRGATKELFPEIAKAVACMPKEKGLNIDGGDDILKVLGYPVSFLRNHAQNKAVVMTITEAETLDIIALSGKKWLWYPE